MSNPIKPRVVQLITSQWLRDKRRGAAEKKRQKSKSPHSITVYLRLNDPHSYLLLQVLTAFAERYPVHYDFRTILNLQPDMYPAPALWEKAAFADCRHLAELYSLPFPEQPPQCDPERDRRLTSQLLHWELQPGYLEHALPLFHAYWQGDAAQIDALVDRRITDHGQCYDHHLQANEKLLKDSGHFFSALLHYSGEWYWGVDRLEHLERRLNDLGAHRTATAEIHFNKTYTGFCSAPSPEGAKATSAIELYWSIRSPYSYIGLVRARQLAEHYGVVLEVKPVLPMVMRRMQVPATKGFYFIKDAKREADKHGIPFGYVADPLGAGVERCYALYSYAQSEGVGVAFLESYARGVWSEGIRSDTDAGLRKLVERVGLNWRHAQQLLQDDRWRLWAQDNLAELYGHDLWGVPSLVYGQTKVFGQDRIDRIERAIVNDLTTEN
ncbi:MAG: disulfide bond formation protein DsbA [SAR92 bacterium BACL16 MAG-120619-bin48]|jgi:2-hydroxychromene-2-carboxylate isomerase|nr:MAG: disulfide bond formation protein DsbA [SAR92 bacterium BACL16 MAG-120619-bin48]HAU02580.1 disulfide bond formation protein DsbA [Porticoccaceae bacterium]